MQNPLQITFHDLRHDPEIEKLIHEKYAKLTPAKSEITKCHVVLEKLSKHHKKANMACVRMDLKVAHFEDIVVTEECAEEPALMKSAVIKVFKNGLVRMREEMKRRQNHKRPPLRDNFAPDAEAPQSDETEEDAVL